MKNEKRKIQSIIILILLFILCIVATAGITTLYVNKTNEDKIKESTTTTIEIITTKAMPRATQLNKTTIPANKQSLQLEKIEVEGRDIEFSPTKYYYDIDVPYNVTKLNIKTKAMNENTRTFSSGENNLKVGLNLITLQTYNEDGEYAFYRLYVYRANQSGEINITNETNITKKEQQETTTTNKTDTTISIQQITNKTITKTTATNTTSTKNTTSNSTKKPTTLKSTSKTTSTTTKATTTTTATTKPTTATTKKISEKEKLINYLEKNGYVKKENYYGKLEGKLLSTINIEDKTYSTYKTEKGAQLLTQYNWEKDTGNIAYVDTVYDSQNAASYNFKTKKYTCDSKYQTDYTFFCINEKSNNIELLETTKITALLILGVSGVNINEL